MVVLVAFLTLVFGAAGPEAAPFSILVAEAGVLANGVAFLTPLIPEAFLTAADYFGKAVFAGCDVVGAFTAGDEACEFVVIPGLTAGLGATPLPLLLTPGAC